MPPPDTFQRFVGPTPFTTGLAANTCLLPWARLPLPSVCEPTKLFIKPRTAAFNVAPFLSVAPGGGVAPLYGGAAQRALDPHPCFSGARTGVTFEGPFLKYTVTKPPFGTWQGLHNDAVMTFFFDLISNRVIFLPFMGSLEITGQYPGTWDFEVLMQPAQGTMPSPRMAMLPTALDSDATLTLRIGASAATPYRDFEAVPPGSHSFTVNSSDMGVAGAYPTASVWQDSAPTKPGGLVGPTGDPISTYVTSRLFGGVASAFMNRVGQHNAFGQTVTLGTANAEGIVQFHLGWT